MTFGALLASILAVAAASEGTGDPVAAEAAVSAATQGTMASPARCEARDAARDPGAPDGCPVEPAAAAAPAAALDPGAAPAIPVAPDPVATQAIAATPPPTAADAAPPPTAADATPPPAPAAEPTGALADAARVARSAAESGTPIVIAPAELAADPGTVLDVPPAADAAPATGEPSAAGTEPAASADQAPSSAAAAPDAPELPAAPAGPPLSDAGPVLLERVEDFDGWATERLIEPSGDVVVHTVNRAGTVQTCVTVGTLFSLPLVAQQRAAGGEWVHVARDASGALVSYAVAADGEPRAVRVLAPPSRAEAAELTIPASARAARP